MKNILRAIILSTFVLSSISAALAQVKGAPTGGTQCYINGQWVFIAQGGCPSSSGSSTKSNSTHDAVADATISVAERKRQRENEARDLFNRGKAAYLRKDYDTAIKLIQQANALVPSDTYRRDILQARAAKANSEGNVYYRAKNWDAAIKSYEEALRYDPTNRTAASNLKLARSAKANTQGDQYYRDKNWDAAILSYEEALRYYPTNSIAASNLKLARSAKANTQGDQYYRDKNWDAAISSYEEALHYDPKNSTAASNLKLARSAKAKESQNQNPQLKDCSQATDCLSRCQCQLDNDNASCGPADISCVNLNNRNWSECRRVGGCE
jgi:tetratricopeptide (TPR) repeat protein